jgi:molybdate/tungstate transport system substrate-binding protein
MLVSRRRAIATSSALLAVGGVTRQARAAEQKITVAFAGSMGVVMDKSIGPAFEAKTGTQYQGIGQAALGLAHLLVARSLTVDVFVSVSPAPIKLVEAAKLTADAVPVASTEMVLAYSPKSKFAAALADQGSNWTDILGQPNLRFGRTDPHTDPQGQYVLYTLQLAALYYNKPGLEAQIAGTDANSHQIFAEPSLLARLQDGEIDATIGYKSAVISQKLPYVTLPPEINFSDPSKAKTWYSKASLTLTAKGVTKTLHPGALVFYAAALANAPNPQAAAAFVAFLQSPEGQALFAKYGYNPGKGTAI